MRSSTPSKRPHRRTTPSPPARLRTMYCFSGMPRGESSSRGRRSSASRLSSAAATTSARSTMPGPPPAGVSSTARWRPRPNSRRATVSSAQAEPSARPASERPSGPGNISGKRVMMVARHIGAVIPPFSPPLLRIVPRWRFALDLVGKRHNDPSARHIDDWHHGSRERKDAYALPRAARSRRRRRSHGSRRPCRAAAPSAVSARSPIRSAW